MTRRLMAFAVLALCCATVSGQDGRTESRRKALLEGTQVLRRILHDHGCTPLDGFADLKDEPSRTLLVILGDLSGLNDVPGGLETFLRNGGAALIASDRAASEQTRQVLVASTGVSISSDKLICPNPANCYRGLEFCPFLVADARANPNLMDNEGRTLPVAANVPSMLRLRNPALARPVVRLPLDCLLESRGKRHRPLEEYVLFGTVAEPGDGRVLVLADHSLFINEMMLPFDTNNVEFTYNALQWLQGDGRQRTRVLFLDEGGIQTKFDIPLKSAQLPVEEALKVLFDRRNALLREGEQWVNRRQREGAFGPGFVGWLERNGWPWGTILGYALIGISLAGLVYLFYRLGIRERFHHDRTAEPLVQAAGDRLPAVPLASQRVAAMLEARDARDALVEFARVWLLSLGVMPPESKKATPPPFVVPGGWWTRRALSARLARVWRLAAGAHPGRISPHAVAWWQREMDDLKTRFSRGDWAPPEQAPRRRMDDNRAA